MREWILEWLGFGGDWKLKALQCIDGLMDDNKELIERLQALEDTVRDHVTQLFEANRYANELHERTLKIAELEDSRKALWDALIELERKVTADRDRTLALERKAEDSGRIQAGGGVNRMRALISEQGGVKDGMMQQGFVR